MKRILLGFCGVAAVVFFTGCYTTISPGVSIYTPGFYPAVVYGPAPVPGMVWVEGDWFISGGRWHQHPGGWVSPPFRGARYHPGHWGPRHTVWRNGYWR